MKKFNNLLNYIMYPHNSILKVLFSTVLINEIIINKLYINLRGKMVDMGNLEMMMIGSII